MLELATLGLLQSEPLHGYRLKQQLELFMSSSISVNYGAIYPLLKRLEERGEITTLAIDQTDAGPNRKTYCITASGRQRWHEKMMEHPHESWVNSRSRFFIKFFFFGNLERVERIKLLEHRLHVCQLRLESLELEQLSVTDPYQKSLLYHCFGVHRAEIEWLREQLTQEQKQFAQSQP
ncbi:PadR family transcriptional regulator [Microcoleus sp. FACHB-53]|jgi:DNA-binding PadR family transcriptional regulator|nr:PadR family transcriptional regulator [Microcoleus sp. FACHB-53]MBD2128854.1 PadR family transcriptional regulator [Microcoleus sp. FACHB-1]